MRGDLLFYAGSEWQSQLIAKATHGPFSHVAVDMGDGTTVAAVSQGICRQGVGSPAGRWSVEGQSLDVDKGMAWLVAQIGQPYGYADIVSHGLKIIGIPVQVTQGKSYDCSDLATRYLEHAEFEGLGALEDNPNLVSPNDLARQLGVIK